MPKVLIWEDRSSPIIGTSRPSRLCCGAHLQRLVDVHEQRGCQAAAVLSTVHQPDIRGSQDARIPPHDEETSGATSIYGRAFGPES